MPTLSSAEKATIKRYAASSTDKILSAAVGRVYYSWPDASNWAYSGLEGAIVFGSTERGKGGFWLKMVDIVGSRGVTWQHEFYDDLVYHQDRTFFHSFAGDECMIGIVYSDESEAGSLYKKVSNRSKHAPKKTESSGRRSGISSATGLFKRKRNVNKEEISQPSNYKHVAHMGFDSEKGFTAENVDPEWSALLQQLTSMGISESQIKDNEAFIRDFVKTAGGPEQAMAPPVRSAPPPVPAARKAAPTAPAPRRVEPPAARLPAPSAPARAPPSRRPDPPAEAPVLSAPVSVPPPPPPPPMMPPARTSHAPPAPPSQPPQRAGPPIPPPAPPSRAAVPPPPPAPMARSSGPPAPPPPPPMGNRAGPPVPPPPPPAAPSSSSAAPSAALPPAQEGRASLLASIQGAGIHQLKKAPSTAAVGGAAMGAGAVAASTPQPEEEASGGDLAATLAAALSARKGNMGDSDDESDDEEWED